jgi:hypothetical protein
MAIYPIRRLIPSWEIAGGQERGYSNLHLHSGSGQYIRHGVREEAP